MSAAVSLGSKRPKHVRPSVAEFLENAESILYDSAFSLMQHVALSDKMIQEALLDYSDQHKTPPHGVFDRFSRATKDLSLQIVFPQGHLSRFCTYDMQDVEEERARLPHTLEREIFDAGVYLMTEGNANVYPLTLVAASKIFLRKSEHRLDAQAVSEELGEHKDVKAIRKVTTRAKTQIVNQLEHENKTEEAIQARRLFALNP